jgi:hypothetical protein
MPTIYKSSKTFKPERRKILKKIAVKSASVLDIVGEVERVKQQHKKNKIWTAKSDREEYLKAKKVKKIKMAILE